MLSKKQKVELQELETMFLEKYFEEKDEVEDEIYAAS